jgi:hypothetical protein
MDKIKIDGILSKITTLQDGTVRIYFDLQESKDAKNLIDLINNFVGLTIELK